MNSNTQITDQRIEQFAKLTGLPLDITRSAFQTIFHQDNISDTITELRNAKCKIQSLEQEIESILNLELGVTDYQYDI